jgi:tetratricopeptide (TPR) repeat protein
MFVLRVNGRDINDLRRTLVSLEILLMEVATSLDSSVANCKLSERVSRGISELRSLSPLFRYCEGSPNEKALDVRESVARLKVRASAAFKANLLDEALALCEEVLEIYMIECQYLLSYFILLFRIVILFRAFSRIQAVSMEPFEATHLANRSLAHLRLRNLGAALADAKAAVELSPKWGKAHFRLGCALRSNATIDGSCTAGDADRNSAPVLWPTTAPLEVV